MGDRLGPYRAKRDSARRRSRPRRRRPASAAQRYVVQEHHARAMHWDLRLEHEGTLASWAVPKGIPADPKRNHLAVRTEDRPLEYLDFHGDIPEGNYGAGTMRIWDRGTYKLHKFREDEVMVTFHGERLAGRYVLFRTDGKNWMIHRMDPPEDPDREPMPRGIEPMLAARAGSRPTTAAGPTRSSGTACARSATRRAGGCGSRPQRPRHHARYPELRELGRELGSREAVLDGEVVAFGPDGRPSFQAPPEPYARGLGQRSQRLAPSDPVAYVIFDLLWLDGHPLIGLLYGERELLLELGLNGPTGRRPRTGSGTARCCSRLRARRGWRG